MPCESEAAYLNVRIAKETREDWRRAADARGVTLSDLIRQAVANELGATDPGLAGAQTNELPSTAAVRAHSSGCDCVACQISRKLEALQRIC